MGRAVAGRAGQKPASSSRQEEEWTLRVLGAHGVGRVECASHTWGAPPNGVQGLTTSAATLGTGRQGSRPQEGAVSGR